MKYITKWDPAHLVGTVCNAEESGMPYLGIVRRQDHLGGWTATSAMYGAHKELGVYGGEHGEQEAIDAVVLEADMVTHRRATNAGIASAGVRAARITGTGRATIDPTGFDRKAAVQSSMFSKRGRRKKTKADEVEAPDAPDAVVDDGIDAFLDEAAL